MLRQGRTRQSLPWTEGQEQISTCCAVVLYCAVLCCVCCVRCVCYPRRLSGQYYYLLVGTAVYVCSATAKCGTADAPAAVVEYAVRPLLMCPSGSSSGPCPSATLARTACISRCRFYLHWARPTVQTGARERKDDNAVGRGRTVGRGRGRGRTVGQLRANCPGGGESTKRLPSLIVLGTTTTPCR